LKKLAFIISIILILFNSCGSSHSKKTNDNNISFISTKLDSCDQSSRDRFLYSFMKDAYYFSDEVQDLDISKYDSLDDSSFLDILKSDKDRFSFIISNKIYDDYFVDENTRDFGVMSIQSDDENTTLVIYVKENSPAFKAGIKRSDFIKLLKLYDDNKSAKIRVFSNDGRKRDIVLKEESYLKKEVSNVHIFDLFNKKIGYFVLNSFIGKNIDRDLDLLFKRFKGSGVNDLVLDLRYNGGGDINIASHLATLIAGKKSFGEVFQHHLFNKHYSKYNNDSHFDKSSPFSLNLDRLFVLVTNETASASESLISALRSSKIGMDVVIIGQKTYGKPYSMYPISYCDKVFFPILMKNFNSDYSEDYDNGFEPDCDVEDDLYHNFGDENESMLSNAIYYIKNGQCK